MGLLVHGTWPIKRLQKKHQRQIRPSTGHACLDEAAQGNSGWTRWISHDLKGHGRVKSGSVDTTLQLAIADVGAHLERDNTETENGE